MRYVAPGLKLNVIGFKNTEFHAIPDVATSCVYLPKFICQTWPLQSRNVSTLMHCINFGGNLLTKRSFYVKQAILTIKKDQITREDKELACYEECSRFCWKI